jgi:hypothetical protein
MSSPGNLSSNPQEHVSDSPLLVTRSAWVSKLHPAHIVLVLIVFVVGVSIGLIGNWWLEKDRPQTILRKLKLVVWIYDNNCDSDITQAVLDDAFLVDGLGKKLSDLPSFAPMGSECDPRGQLSFHGFETLIDPESEWTYRMSVAGDSSPSGENREIVTTDLQGDSFTSYYLSMRLSADCGTGRILCEDK